MLGILEIAVCLTVGEALVRMADLPIPGPMAGLLVMLLDCALMRGADPQVEEIFDRASPHFAVLFVPAGAGIVAQADLLSAGLVIVLFAVLAGTAATILVTALVFGLCVPAELAYSRERPAQRPKEARHERAL